MDHLHARRHVEVEVVRVRHEQDIAPVVGVGQRTFAGLAAVDHGEVVVERVDLRVGLPTAGVPDGVVDSEAGLDHLVDQPPSGGGGIPRHTLHEHQAVCEQALHELAVRRGLSAHERVMLEDLRLEAVIPRGTGRRQAHHHGLRCAATAGILHQQRAEDRDEQDRAEGEERRSGQLARPRRDAEDRQVRGQQADNERQLRKLRVHPAGHDGCHRTPLPARPGAECGPVVEDCWDIRLKDKMPNPRIHIPERRQPRKREHPR
mmetsp:Transcript_133025/g.370836  ORF Transcript_133025/g.370836 Transcript_133025/m.370836 type:complete len:261 (+) Transcript_133025:551-1333(+)